VWELPVTEHRPHGASRAAEAVTSMQIGRRSLLAISDGYIDMLPTLIGTPDSPTAGHDALKDESGSYFMPVGCFLVPGEPNVLLDLGLGPLDRSDWEIDLAGGRLLDGLAKVGLAPEDIGVIALSHLHVDHVGWLGGLGGEPVFPNARVHLGAGDWEYFVQGAPELPLDAPVRHALLNLAEEDRVVLHHDDRLIAPGVTRLAAPGHTPGHSVFAVHDGSERALLLGDSLYCPLQLTEVDWAISVDVDPKLARRTRERYLRELESGGDLGVGCHFPELRAGRVLAGSWVEMQTVVS
jgi:glyoxylase-like metal-dependent hydrolase (beta-lactamase superfamily II)